MIKRFRQIAEDIQSFLNYIRTHGYRIRTVFLLAFIIAFFDFGLFCYLTFDTQDLQIYWWALRAKTVQFFWGEHACVYGDSAASWVSRTEYLFRCTNKTLSRFVWYGIAICLSILVILASLTVFLFRRTQKAVKAKEQKFMAGSYLTSKKDVIKMIEEKGTASPLMLMDLPLIHGTETQHIMITGTYGSGKTNAVKHMLNQMLDQKVLLVDTKGELIRKYYNPDRGDIIMNPLDLRYPGWNTRGEDQYDPYYEELEKNLVAGLGWEAHGTKSPLSIKQWIQDDSKTGWLFLSMTRETGETLKPLFSYWLSLAMKSLKDKQSQKQSRLWIVIDTLSDLPKIKDLPFCLSRGAQCGVCMILCTQNFQQLETIYGEQTSKALVEFCATHVLFRCANSDLAQKLTHQINTQTQARYGNKQQISARELAYFPDFVSCVQLPYGYPATKIKWDLAP